MSPTILLDLIKREQLKRAAEKSLAEFIRQGWHVIEHSPYVHGWHIDAICQHLEAVTDGEIIRLLINVPPGTMKSLITNVFWPAWEWGPKKMPYLRYVAASHAEDFSIRDTLTMRRLVSSEWYQSNWPIELAKDQNEKKKFQNSFFGFRQAMSMKGLTGTRGDRVLIDDPHNVEGAHSEAERETTVRVFTQTVTSRLNSPEKSAIIVIMQRLHELDVSGVILSKPNSYVHLMLPMRFDRKRKCTTCLGFSDPRTKDGELLFPERFPEWVVERDSKEMGQYATSGQFQQDPSPPEGGILRTKYFCLWKGDAPAFDYILQSYDCAFTEKNTGDPTACTVWGVFTYKSERNIMLLDSWDEHLGYPQLRKRVINDWGMYYGGKEGISKGRRPDRILVEEKASGQSLLQDLRLAKVPAVGYNPFKSDKIARAHQAAPTLEAGYIWIPESKNNPGQFVSWAQSMLNQIIKFPRAAHDDYVDTFTQAVIFLKNDGWFELQQADDRDEPRQRHDARLNPYAR
jgi:predicted phage terminase large subunit-like protein